MAVTINASTTAGLVNTADTSGVLQLQTAGTTAVTVDASQNVGIGTATPASRISSTGSSATTFAALTLRNSNGTVNSSAVLNFEASSGTEGDSGSSAAQIRGIRTGSGTSGALAFWTSDAGVPAERARFTSGGDFVIGATSSTGGKFEVTQSANSSGAAVFSTNASQSNAVMFFSASRNTTNNSFYYLDCYNATGGTYKLRIADSGNVTNTNNSYGAISDAKLKENIVDASPKLANLMQVKVRNYNLIGETTKQIGVVAQELETVFPAMVDESPDRDAEGNDLGTTTKAVKYSVFVPMLIKAIQEQQALITQLQADVATLKGTP